MVVPKIIHVWVASSSKHPSSLPRVALPQYATVSWSSICVDQQFYASRQYTLGTGSTLRWIYLWRDLPLKLVCYYDTNDQPFCFCVTSYEFGFLRLLYFRFVFHVNNSKLIITVYKVEDKLFITQNHKNNRSKKLKCKNSVT